MGQRKSNRILSRPGQAFEMMFWFSMGWKIWVKKFRVHLIYQPEKAWLQSNEAALNAERVEAIAKENTRGKRAVVFAVAKFMSQKELTKKRIEFCQLPYAIHRILGD